MADDPRYMRASTAWKVMSAGFAFTAAVAAFVFGIHATHVAKPAHEGQMVSTAELRKDIETIHGDIGDLAGDLNNAVSDVRDDLAGISQSVNRMNREIFRLQLRIEGANAVEGPPTVPPYYAPADDG